MADTIETAARALEDAKGAVSLWVLENALDLNAILRAHYEGKAYATELADLLGGWNEATQLMLRAIQQEAADGAARAARGSLA